MRFSLEDPLLQHPQRLGLGVLGLCLKSLEKRGIIKNSDYLIDRLSIEIYDDETLVKAYIHAFKLEQGILAFPFLFDHCESVSEVVRVEMHNLVTNSTIRNDAKLLVQDKEKQKGAVLFDFDGKRISLFPKYLSGFRTHNKRGTKLSTVYFSDGCIRRILENRESPMKPSSFDILGCVDMHQGVAKQDFRVPWYSIVLSHLSHVGIVGIKKSGVKTASDAYNQNCPYILYPEVDDLLEFIRYRPKMIPKSPSIFYVDLESLVLKTFKDAAKGSYRLPAVHSTVVVHERWNKHTICTRESKRHEEPSPKYNHLLATSLEHFPGFKEIPKESDGTTFYKSCPLSSHIRSSILGGIHWTSGFQSIEWELKSDFLANPIIQSFTFNKKGLNAMFDAESDSVESRFRDAVHECLLGRLREANYQWADLNKKREKYFYRIRNSRKNIDLETTFYDMFPIGSYKTLAKDFEVINRFFRESETKAIKNVFIASLLSFNGDFAK